MNIPWEIVITAAGVLLAIATLTIVIRQWKESHPKIILRFWPDTAVTLYDGKIIDNVFVIHAINRGRAATTIQRIEVIEYSNWWYKIFKKERDKYIILHANFPDTDHGKLPHFLKSGSKWAGMIDQTNLEEALTNACVYVGILCAHKDKPIMKRVRIKNTGI